MRLRALDKRTVTLMPPLPRPVYQPEDKPCFDSGAAWRMQAVLRPMRTVAYARLYGERVERMLLMLTEVETPLTEGMGVCVDSETECDHRIALPPEKWRRHQRVVLERLDG